MATYVMGDVHGDISRYQSMLAHFSFSSTDMLYILGDVIDRGHYGVKLLQEIMKQNNITLLVGNHEQMLLDTFEQAGISTEVRDNWTRNGGGVTAHDMLNLSPLEREHILHYLRGCPTELNITVNEKNFYLVHGTPAETKRERLWGRFAITQSYQEIVGDRTILFGHTPTWYYQQTPPGAHAIIWTGPQCVGLDCGCGHNRPDARLACLRLDDLQIFYS